jgi:uncharacterized protein (DUF1778 family)
MRLRAGIDSYGNLPYVHTMAHVPTTARLEARLPASVHKLLKRAAEIQGRTLTDFVVAAAQEAACRTIEEADVVRLSAEDQRRIADAILKPAAPTPALRRAFQRRRALLRNA